MVDWWLGGYWSSLTDLIQWQQDSASRWRPVNVDTASIIGIEAEVGLDLGSAGADAGLSYTSATSDTERLYYRPEVTARAGLWGEHRLEQVSARVTLGFEHTGNRLTDGAPDTLPAFSLVNAGVRLGPVVEQVDVAIDFGVRNVFDTRYQTVRDFPVPGRNWYLELLLGI
jgi:outer membrane receptor protein involved in Fe transport